MVLIGKIALGCGAGVVLMTAYTFRQGVLRIDVDESRRGGSHIHLWMPAAVVPSVMHLIPSDAMKGMDERAREFMPLVHSVAKELERYPEAEFMEIQDGPQHAHVRTHNGRLLIDVDEPGDHVHVAVPLATVDDVATQLAAYAPAS